jgi:hypothetical protein
MQSVFDLMQQSVNNGARLAQSFGRNTPSPAFQCAINNLRVQHRNSRASMSILEEGTISAISRTRPRATTTAAVAGSFLIGMSTSGMPRLSCSNRRLDRDPASERLNVAVPAPETIFAAQCIGRSQRWHG